MSLLISFAFQFTFSFICFAGEGHCNRQLPAIPTGPHRDIWVRFLWLSWTHKWVRLHCVQCSNIHHRIITCLWSSFYIRQRKSGLEVLLCHVTVFGIMEFCRLQTINNSISDFKFGIYRISRPIRRTFFPRNMWCKFDPHLMRQG